MVRIQFPFYVGRKWIAQQHSELEIMTALFETRHFSWAWRVSALLTLLSVIGDRPLDSPTRENIAREFQGLRDWTEDGHPVLPERILNLIETRIDEQMASCEKAPNRSMIGRAYWIASKSASCYFQVATYACAVLAPIAFVVSVPFAAIFAAGAVGLLVLCSFVDGASNKRIRKLDESMWEEFKERLVREGFVPADSGSIEGPSPMDKS